MITLICTLNDYNYSYSVNKIPKKCPHCGKLVSLKLLFVVPEKSIDTLDKEEKYFSFIFQCDVSCSKIIVAIYKETIEHSIYAYIYSHYYPKSEFSSPAFSDIISTLSPNFIEIYKQSAIELNTINVKISQVQDTEKHWNLL